MVRRRCFWQTKGERDLIRDPISVLVSVSFLAIEILFLFRTLPEIEQEHDEQKRPVVLVPPVEHSAHEVVDDKDQHAQLVQNIVGDDNARRKIPGQHFIKHLSRRRDVRFLFGD